MTPEPRRSSARRILAAATDRPLLVVALVASLVAIGHGIWIWTHRRVGALDPDEAGYIATAFRYHRTFDLFDPMEFVRAVGGTGFAPLVPLVSVPLLWIGPDDPRTVMLSQPLLMVLGALIVAGITRRLASPGAAIGAGLAFVAIPTVVTATQSYWFGLGATVAFGGALWALLASDRCATRTTWWFGVGIAAMVLSRTMALGFVPAAAAAALVITRWDRRSLTRLAQAAAIAVVIAGPWWYVEWSTIFGYLSDYGYGDRAGLYGSGGTAERLRFRLDRLSEAFGPNIVVTAAAVALVAAVWAVARRRGRPVMTESLRAGLALAAAALAGLAALVSTSNSGVWFELPLVMTLIPLAALVASAAPWRLGTVLAVPVVGMLCFQTAVSWWWISPLEGGVPWLAENHLDSSQQEDGFAEYDLRFAQSNRGQERVAAEEWRSLTEQVSRIATDIETSDGPVSFWLSGNMQLFNTNTMYLRAEMTGRDTLYRIPDTTQPARRRAADLTPTVEGRDDDFVERVLIVALHDRILFPPDFGVADFATQATEMGWRVTDRVPMPGGGVVQVMRHRSASGD